MSILHKILLLRPFWGFSSLGPQKSYLFYTKKFVHKKICLYKNLSILHIIIIINILF